VQRQRKFTRIHIVDLLLLFGNHKHIKLLNKSESKTAAETIRSVIDVNSYQLVEILDDL
jgi:hypothetical protein